MFAAGSPYRSGLHNAASVYGSNALVGEIHRSRRGAASATIGVAKHRHAVREQSRQVCCEAVEIGVSSGRCAPQRAELFFSQHLSRRFTIRNSRDDTSDKLRETRKLFLAQLLSEWL